MSPLDSLKKSNDKIYRSQGRVNFLVNQNQPQAIDSVNRFEKPRDKKMVFIKILFIVCLLCFMFGAMYLSERVFSEGNETLSGLNKFNPFKRLVHLVTADDKKIEGELDDRVNILALGIGGEGHDGPHLTDTIIVASIKPSTGEIGLISIPRDMLVPMRDGNWYKINQIYAMGRSQSQEKGIAYISQAVEDIFDIDLHYYGIVNFWGFENFIDQIGGISVEVPRSFTDRQYPTDDYKIQTVSFEQGLQVMNGRTALIYARSRHGDNFEGSDFARSQRQQLILQSVKEKLFKFSTLLNPGKLAAIFDLLGNSVETNMSVWQAIKLAELVKETDDDKIYRIILDDMPDSILEPDFTEEGAWILKPKDGNYQTLARQFNDIFNTSKIQEEDAWLEIQNGTLEPGLAYWTSSFLEKLGYTIFKYSNAQSQDYQRTVIYDLSDGKYKQTLRQLKEELGAYEAKPIPDYILEGYQTQRTETAEPKNHPDILAILGVDHAERFKLPEEKTASSTDELATSTEELLEEELTEKEDE